MKTIEANSVKSQLTLGEIAEAFWQEAESLCTDRREAEILATTALVNFLSRYLPKFSSLRDIIERSSIASSLS